MITSTGTPFSASTPTARDPTVISSAKVRLSAKSRVTVPASGRNVHVRGSSPAALTFTSCGWPAASAGRVRV